tara:strand:- start:8438 stop:10471 length:2034 start_codon:yes stop_codon:yes gene_type:complete
MHIVHAIDSLGVGGAQSMMFELHKAIEKYYPEVTQIIMLLNESKFDRKFVESYHIKHYNVARELFAKTVLSYEFPVIVLFHKLMSSPTDFFKNLYPRIPLVLLNHTHTEKYGYNKFRPCDIVICVSKYMKKNIARYNPQHRIEVIHNGIDGANYEHIPALKKEDDKKTLVTGRINALNNIKYSDSWLKWLAKIELPSKFVHEYMGGGLFLRRGQKLAKKLNKQSANEIRMLGAINELDNKIARLKSWDLFLYEINVNEGISIAILEAMACGIPVICSNHYGNKEIIQNGVNGYVFDSKAEAKDILIEFALDRKMLKDLQISTKKYFDEHLDIRYTVEKYMDLFVWLNEAPRPTASDLKQKIKVLPNDQRTVLESIKPIRKRIRNKNQVIPNVELPKKSKNKKMSSRVPETKVVLEHKVESSSDNPKFTILTSGHNSEQFLMDWSNSIIHQNYRPLEVIYVDDCSRDGSLEQLKQLAKRFKQESIELKVIKNMKRAFCGSSYYIGQSQATGEFFGVLDADDMLADDAVDFIMKQYVKHPDLTYIYTQFEVCTNKMKSKARGFSRAPHPGETLLTMGKKRKHAFSHWRTFSKRFPQCGKLFKRGLRCSIDKYMGYRLEEFGKGAFIDRVCYKYRQHSSPANISSTEPTKKIWEKVTNEAVTRRKSYKLKPHTIVTLSLT